eukprot:3412156-Amphidinium_carterae.3
MKLSEGFQPFGIRCALTVPFQLGNSVSDARRSLKTSHTLSFDAPTGTKNDETWSSRKTTQPLPLV